MAEQYNIILDRVAQPAEMNRESMMKISLTRLLTKVADSVVGTTKLRHIEGAEKAAELILTNW